MKLFELIEQYGANAFLLQDTGNGSAMGMDKDALYLTYDEHRHEQYNLEMHEIDDKWLNTADGIVTVKFESDTISTDIYTSSAYKFKVLF